MAPGRNSLTIVLLSMLLFALVEFPRVVIADIAREVRQGDSDSSAFFELGVGILYDKIPIVAFLDDSSSDPNEDVFSLGLLINGRAEWHGLFIELFHESFAVGALGYNAWSTENSSFDIVLTSEFDDYDPSVEGFESLEERDGDALIGLRGTRYFNNNIIQMELYGDVSDTHNGTIAGVQAGRHWQVRNWNLHTLVGARYYSDRVLDHYLGISSDEARADLPAYQASGGTLGTLEFGATVPLSEKWIFRTTAKGLYLPDAVTDSPLGDGHLGVELSSTFNYVF